MLELLARLFGTAAREAVRRWRPPRELREAALARWAARRDFRYTAAKFAPLGGSPFTTAGGRVDVLSGTWRGRPALVTQFRVRWTPRRVVAVAVELPAPRAVPDPPRLACSVRVDGRLAVVWTGGVVGPWTLDLPERLLGRVDTVLATAVAAPESAETAPLSGVRLGAPVHRTVQETMREQHGGRAVELIDLTAPGGPPLLGARIALDGPPPPPVSVVRRGVLDHDLDLAAELDDTGPFAVATDDAAAARALLDGGLGRWLVADAPPALLGVAVAGQVRRVGHPDRGLVTVTCPGWLDDPDARAAAAALAATVRDLV